MTETAASFTCPCCGITSHHPMDLEHRYCAKCSWWTGDPQLGPAHMEEPCEARAERSHRKPGIRLWPRNLH